MWWGNTPSVPHYQGEVWRPKPPRNQGAVLAGKYSAPRKIKNKRVIGHLLHAWAKVPYNKQTCFAVFLSTFQAWKWRGNVLRFLMCNFVLNGDLCVWRWYVKVNIRTFYRYRNHYPRWVNTADYGEFKKITHCVKSCCCNLLAKQLTIILCWKKT